ncbi:MULTISPECIES: DUF3109 family protein [unclassified Lentimicrobium]|uniref:DUF3109 family protein n=1 Tax=unclassified Lentimicrobium TaxID=2677434 RepID=UPI0015533815|nr:MULTISPECIES: DUF3109 family protein [unclassified Lentimicrobium]NPD44914.1 DUF3109 family protein [Lentimicrobium sp. S6]NPD85891.1 DUF3109 family protein [Lentimicrobium sp. L6]
MISIGKTIISEEVVKKQFSCDLNACHGECCIQGDSGAPLEEEEIGVIEDCLDEIKPYMTKSGKAAVRKNGIFDYDSDGDFVTTLVKGQECAFVYFEGEIALCAIEKAYREGKINYYKPISCHLYPIRISQYKDFEAINYHKWEICDLALLKGKKEQSAIYEFLKEPLIRKYGEDWYKQLDEEVKSGRYDEILNRE